MRRIKVKKNLKLKTRKLIEKGFSLVELLVTVAIMGVLAAVGIFAYNKYIQSSQKATNEANAKSLADALSAEASSPNICNGLDGNNNPTNLNYPGDLNSPPKQGFWDGSSIVACANKILVQNSFVNPYTQHVYGGQGNINPLNTFISPPHFGFDAGGSTNDTQVVATNTQTGVPLYIDVGVGTTILFTGASYPPTGSTVAAISQTYSSGPIFCSDQLNGNPVSYLYDNTGAPTYSGGYDNGSSWYPSNISPPAGLILVLHGGTKYGVATCDPYTGTIGAIFDIVSPF